jgi:hypothetical protein
LSAVAVAGATLYNLGYFAPIEWSLISLLTVRDLLIGSAIGAIPVFQKISRPPARAVGPTRTAAGNSFSAIGMQPMRCT